MSISVPNNANTFLPPSPVIPKALLITNITATNPMVITVATPNSYIAGQLVFLTIPASYGMFQANGLTGQIISINNLNLTVAIDATLFDSFVIPSATQETPSSLSPAGSRNIYNNLIVPFHSLGNIGN